MSCKATSAGCADYRVKTRIDCAPRRCYLSPGATATHHHEVRNYSVLDLRIDVRSSGTVAGKLAYPAHSDEWQATFNINARGHSPDQAIIQRQPATPAGFERVQIDVTVARLTGAGPTETVPPMTLTLQFG